MERNEESFYVLLPSNVDPDGSAAKYRTSLENSITLNEYGDWEVGLVEMQFVDAIKTFTGNECVGLHGLEVQKVPKTMVKIPGDLRIQYISYLDIRWKYYIIDTAIYVRLVNQSWSEFISLTHENGRFHMKPLKKGDKLLKKIKLGAGLAWTLGFHEKLDLTEEKLKLVSKIPSYFFTTEILKDVVIEFDDDQSPVSATLERSNREYVRLCGENYVGMNWYSIEYTSDLIMKTPLYGSYCVKSDRYQNVTSLSKALNEEIFNKDDFANHKIKMSPDSVKTDQLMLEATGNPDKTKGRETLVFNERLASLLGFTKTHIAIPRGEKIKLKAKYPPSYQRSIYTIYVYCNLCENMNVGNKRVPLLRNVAFNNEKYGSTISIVYTNPIYVKVNTRFINSIEVELRDDMGELIPFAEGKTSINLHFRRQRL